MAPMLLLKWFLGTNMREPKSSSKDPRTSEANGVTPCNSTECPPLGGGTFSYSSRTDPAYEPSKTDEDFRLWYLQRLLNNGVLQGRDLETAKIFEMSTNEKEQREFSNWFFENSTLSPMLRSDIVKRIWDHRKTIRDSAAQYHVDPNFVAAVLTLTQSIVGSVSLRDKAIQQAPSLKNVIPKGLDVQIPESVSDYVGGITTGKTSVGLGQVLIPSVRKYNLQGMGQRSDFEITRKLTDDDVNIRCVAEYIGIVAKEVDQRLRGDAEFAKEAGTSPGAWTTATYLNLIYSRYVSSKMKIDSGSSPISDMKSAYEKLAIF